MEKGQTIKLDTKEFENLKYLSPEAIGAAVSAAIKNGQFTFTFATDKSGVLNFD